MSLPQRVQDELLAAEALEAADKAARSQAPTTVANAADLIVQPAPSAVSAPPQEPPPPAPPPAQEEETYRHKYKSLQGVYNADVVQLRNQIKDLVSQVQVLSSVKEAPQAAQSSVDPKDIEVFGEEMMGMVQRYVTGAVTTLESRIAGLEASINGVAQRTAETAEQHFYKLLTELVPDWRKVNGDDTWLEWLGVADDVYGVPRQAALDNAFKNLDAHRVANVFRAYKAALPKVSTPTLESQITPDGAGNSAPAPAPAKPFLSEKAIMSFYKDMAQGAYVGREKEAETIEAEINLAVAEGRVR
jgi:hypothetical protein